jgi:hypothetical protein
VNSSLPCRCEVPSARVLEGFRLARIELHWYLPFRARAGRTNRPSSLRSGGRLQLNFSRHADPG